MIENIVVFENIGIINTKRQVSTLVRRMTGETVNRTDLVVGRIKVPGLDNINESLMVVPNLFLCSSASTTTSTDAGAAAPVSRAPSTLITGVGTI